MTKLFLWPLLAMAVLMFGGCTTKPTVGQNNINDLALAIQGLGPDVDPEEAQRAASIAYRHSLRLAQEYQITDPPIVHNTKIHHGLRERGLCNHYTEDMLERLNQERFRTLSLHWATSPSSMFRIVHHTAVISRQGAKVEDGIVLDPWRYGGALFWSPTRADERYNWQLLDDVQELLRARRGKAASKAN